MEPERYCPKFAIESLIPLCIAVSYPSLLKLDDEQ
jgi:hypothetical protein